MKAARDPFYPVVDAEGGSFQGLTRLCRGGEELGDAWVNSILKTFLTNCENFRVGIRSRGKLHRFFFVESSRRLSVAWRVANPEAGALAESSNLN